jgi:signal transduction histidine kinase
MRTRLTLGFAAGMALVLAALSMFLYARVGHELLSGIDMDLRSRAQVVAPAIGGRDPRLLSGETRGRLIDPDEAFAQVLSASGRIVDSSSAVAGAPMLGRRDLRSLRGPGSFTRRVRGIDDPARLLAVPRRTRSGRVYVVVGSTLGDRNEALARLALALAIGGPVALALVSWAGWLLAGAALRPVGAMAREAAAVSLSEPGRRLPVSPTGDELAHLGETLNGMLDRLEESLRREQRFLDRASHELRTPLGVLRMELDLALTKARTEEDLRKALRNASTETDRLTRLAEDLLVLSRAREGKLALHRRETRVDQLLERVAEAQEATAGAAGVAIVVDCPAPLAARVDPERLRQAVDDLVDNALRHSPDGGVVTLSAERSDGLLRVTVGDGGSGFPIEMLSAPPPEGPDPTSASSGLGLAIVSAIARAHGGVLRLENAGQGGGRASVELSV